ncbi:hypothetical protein [Streptomyces sp. NPDC051921]|uniref:hypothetical protein n=1 Tax=Streptomyces sp. NPDC051921 TaxID=3155806 RepID=UPI003427F910
MGRHTGGRGSQNAGHGRRRLTDEEFSALMKEARAEASGQFMGHPPTGEPDFSLRTQHAEFGAAAH